MIPVVATVATPPAPETAPEKPPAGREIDPISMTTEMEPISEAVEQKRRVDATLARFSAVHDQMAEEEEARRSRRMRLMPWLAHDAAMEEALAPTPLPESHRPTKVGITESEPARVDTRTRLQAKKQRRIGRATIVGKIAAGAVALTVLLITGFAYLTKGQFVGAIQEVAALDMNSPAIQNAQAQLHDENFLLVGAQTRAGVNSQALLTDTIMVAHVPADRSRVVVTSFPPSLAVNRPACQQWNNENSQYGATAVPASTGVKLDSVYGVGGPRCLTDTVQQLTGLRINHFVGIDFQGFKQLVDAGGGVSMCVLAPMRDTTLGTIIDHNGTSTLTGDQALGFVRAANVTGDTTGDIGRIKRQQRFLASMLRSMMSQNVLLTPSKLNDLLSAFTSSTFDDNLSVDQMVAFAQSIQGLNLGRVTFVTAPTTGAIDDHGRSTLDADLSKQLFTTIIGNGALPGEAQPTAATTLASPGDTTVVDPKTIKIQVLNGGDPTPNTATNTANALRDQGFQVMLVNNAPSTVPQTVIKFSADARAAAMTLASAVPAAVLQEDPAAGGAVTLIIAAGFDGKVVAAHAGFTPATAASPPNPALMNLATVNASDTSCGW